MSLKPVFDHIVRTLFPVTFPLGIDVDRPRKAPSSLKVKSMQGAEKQGRFVGCLLQMLNKYPISRVAFKQIKPGILFNLNTLGLRYIQSDI